MPKPQEIAIIAAPRSGTNYFCDTLGAFDEVASFFELFNPRGVFGLERLPAIYDHLSSCLGQDVDGVSDPDLIRFVKENPVRFLEVLSAGVEALEKKALSYKIFPGQLPAHTLEELLSNPERRFMFIVRSRIDTFISFKKAMELDNWINRPTGDLMVEVSFDEFMEWAALQDKWYAEAEDILRRANQRYIAFSYEADINVPKETLVEKQYLSLRSLGVDAFFPDTVTPPRFKRQDKLIGPFKKIANGEELKQQFLSQGLLGKYALRNPLIRLSSDG